MATVRKNKKKTIIIIICIVLAIAAIATAVTVYAIDSQIPQVSLYTIGTSDIYESVNSTGTVSSGAAKSYKVGSVATVKEVFVKVGDEVKKGDALATFDTSNYDEQISNMQASYSEAKASYNEAVKSQKEAKSNLSQIDAQIKSLEKEISVLEEKISSQTSSAAESFSQNVADITETAGDFSDDPQVNSVIVGIVMETISGELEKGNTSAQEIANAVAAALTKAVEDGIVDAGQMDVDVDTAVNTVRESVAGVNWSASDQLQSILDSDSVKLITDQITLSSCYAQKQIYTLLASDTPVESRKELMNTTKDALDSLKEAREELAAGWTAAFDGVVTECSISPGEQTNLFSSGITIQNMDTMVVSISLGEYDIHKIALDMPATITTAYGTYSGKVIFKSPVAGGGSSSSSIVDSLGSMMGMSGLSSLTDTGSGVEVQISVDDPDENIIVGFDAAVEIHVGEFIGVPTVPAESMLHDKNGTYVYVYDEDEGTVTKTKIVTGAMSYTEYEVTDGLKQGDRIVYAPQSTFEDTFEVKVSNQ